MDTNKIEAIRIALEEGDLKILDQMAKPNNRTVNKKQGFRSALMLSAHNLKHMLKIEQLEADCIMLNLEDGVSKEQKPFALAITAIFLSELQQSDKKLVVRVNALDEGGFDEITYLNQFRPDAIRVPKIHDASEVNKVLKLLDDDIELHLSIETKEAWANLSTLAVHKRVTTFYLGILDLFASMRLPQSLIHPDNPTMLYMLSHFLVTTKAVGAKPVSFVYQEYKNMEMFRKWLELEKSMGYTAKGCLSPNQVTAVHDILVDEVAELERARIIVKLFEMNRDLGITGFVDDEYGFIDEPIYKGALAVLEMAEGR
ncbi:MAG: aldolase/citrate lyase family protein [Sulfurimonadaceae bacterium]|nr:aldolase/citrate lyase family protein [Sulfurimonadaceae bacterium]